MLESSVALARRDGDNSRRPEPSESRISHRVLAWSVIRAAAATTPYVSTTAIGGIRRGSPLLFPFSGALWLWFSEPRTRINWGWSYVNTRSVFDYFSVSGFHVTMVVSTIYCDPDTREVYPTQDAADNVDRMLGKAAKRNTVAWAPWRKEHGRGLSPKSRHTCSIRGRIFFGSLPISGFVS